MPTKHGFTEKCYGCKYLSLCGHGYACTNEYYCNNADNMDELSLELEESEDERIRKAIMEHFAGSHSSIYPYKGFTKKQILDWLEKQNSNVDNANKEYWRGYREGKQEILDKYAELEKQAKKESNKMPIWKHWKDGICGNGEGKLIYLIKDGDDYSLSSCLGYECDYIELSDLDKLMLQEKQDWSEEDENKIDTIIQIYHPSKKIMDWLKSLKDRIQPHPKQHWCEEDEMKLNEVLGAIAATDYYTLNNKKEIEDWLKSLKPQPKNE